MWRLILSLFVSYLSFFSCHGKAVLRDCGISWVSVFNKIGFIWVYAVS